ncbi:DUF2393 family protein [Campylobacter estrildidarum]|uniref:DUF2393 domain-containing protein n=1 Tax=Campylobacter estrildidarum TaxID=2510189 RepID=A0A4U7BSG5_9BACT|nr:DUF2393 family protein [Campylobacter estrildidarum]TKX31217.1 hypothetical protein CQA69_02960 [Campylobacter estrildidarum]
MEKIREIVLFYVTHLYLVDFMLILFVFFLFVCITFLCVFLRHRPVIALFIIAINLIFCFVIYIFGYKLIDREVRGRKIEIIAQRMMQTSGDLIVDFNITNTSKNNFKECKVTAKIFKNPLSKDNIINKYKDQFVPFRQKSQELKDLKKNTTQFQRIAFENFNYENNYTVGIVSECF